LTYQFFATAGTFSPADRQSELSPVFSSPGEKVHIDSHWSSSGTSIAGLVTIWVVVRDERAGVGWASRTFNLVP
jgi:hypothetical protein